MKSSDDDSDSVAAQRHRQAAWRPWSEMLQIVQELLQPKEGWSAVAALDRWQDPALHGAIYRLIDADGLLRREEGAPRGAGGVVGGRRVH